MIYQSGLLQNGTAFVEHYKVRNTAHLVTCCEVRVSLSVYLQYDRTASHAGSGLCHLWGGHAAGSAPRGPKVHQHWYRSVP